MCKGTSGDVLLRKILDFEAKAVEVEDCSEDVDMAPGLSGGRRRLVFDCVSGSPG